MTADGRTGRQKLYGERKSHGNLSARIGRPVDFAFFTERRGVNLPRIHNDSDAIHGSDEYWHVGRHPPVGPAKMQQLQIQ